MKLKSLFAAAVLMFSTMAHAEWKSSPENSAISSSEIGSDGSLSTVSLHLGGGFVIGSYPKSWDGQPAKDQGITKHTQLAVNGQMVKVNVTMHNNGVMFIEATTYKGQQYIRNEFWNKARVTFVSTVGGRFIVNAKGVQQAWTHMTMNQGI
ncbi:MAG: hypothetical protein ACRCTP_17755 [Aeromonas popoffii]|uniref:hypothetical protein n=1 Tax=Aeromonas popoffii TaxID=70856 RepID=UPI003F4113A0